MNNKKYSIQSLGFTSRSKQILKEVFKIEENLDDLFFEIESFLKEKFPYGFTKEELVSELVKNNKEYLVKEVLDLLEIFRDDRFKKVDGVDLLSGGFRIFGRIKDNISNEEILRNRVPDDRIADDNYFNILESFKHQIVTIYDFEIFHTNQDRFEISHYYPTGIVYLLGLGIFNIEIFDIYIRKGK